MCCLPSIKECLKLMAWQVFGLLTFLLCGGPAVVAVVPVVATAGTGNPSHPCCLSMKRACGWCPRDPDEPYETSHGICDDCLRKYFPEEAELILGQEEHYDYQTP